MVQFVMAWNLDFRRIYSSRVKLFLIDWIEFNALSTIWQLNHGGQFTYSCNSWLSHTSTLHSSLSKQLTASPRRLVPHWWKANNACRIVFCQTLERMLAELGMQLTSAELTTSVATDWTTGARLSKCAIKLIQLTFVLYNWKTVEKEHLILNSINRT